MTSLLERIPPPRQETRRWTIAYWLFQILGWGLYVAAGLLWTLPQTGPLPVVIGGYALFYAYSIALSHGLRTIIRRRDWLSLPPGQVAARLFPAALILGAVLVTLIILTQAVWTWTSPFSVHPQFALATWGSNTFAALCWVAAYTGSAALIRARRAHQDAIALELDMREARLRALEAQLAPHFLFNCLNTLRGMIVENPPLAQDMVTRLANILRHNLLRSTQPLQPLGEQVEFTADYLALEALRFEERLRVTFAIAEETRNVAVPAMLLQTLVENALKHGIAHLADAGEVRIASRFDANTLLISVENTGRFAAAPANSTRVGLHNLRERLRTLHGDNATLELADTGSGRVRATVCIPRATA